MSFVAPKWDSVNNHYVITLTPNLSKNTCVPITRDQTGSTVFMDTDRVLNVTDLVVEQLINEGHANSWFAKLPSHEQLMKRVQNTFGSLATEAHNTAVVNLLLMTPKQLTLVWSPTTLADAQPPPMYFEESDDSEHESDAEPEPEIGESNLPPVSLTDDSKQTHEQYLLTRLRAAKARVEAEQLRMQYFETTGRMPPDSESESEDD